MHHENTSVQQTCRLYQLVFSCVYTKYAVGFLFAAFLIQPIAPAYANEIADNTSDSLEEVVEVEEEESEPEPEPEPVEEEVVDEEESESEADEEVEESEPAIEEVSDENSTEEPEIDETDTAENETDTATTDETVEDDSESATTTPSDSDVVDETASTSTESVATSSDEVLSDDDSVSTTTASTTPTDTGGGGGAADAETEVETATSSSATTTATSTTSQNDVDDVEATDDEILENEDDASNTSATTTDEEIVSTATTTPDSTNATSTASSTVASSTPTTQFISAQSVITNDESYYHFGRHDCVAVGDGSFYCGEKATSTEVVEDGLYTTTDNDGDQEIFHTMNGVTTQITHNVVDDSAPYYDAVSNSIVFHRLLNDRYQVVAYDIETGTETMLTTSPTNSMEPARFGTDTVWQEWVENNWEIMHFDGVSTTQLTTTPEHDIAPAVRDGIIMWSSKTAAGDPIIKVLHQETGELSTIDDDGGGIALNPRIMLVYDSSFDNGDIVTKGFDMKTGEVVPIAALPKELPDEIPESDQTGETRALIQNKSGSNRGGDVVIQDTDTPTSTGTSTPPASTPDVVTTTATATTSDSVQSPTDVVIPPSATSSVETEVSDIVDVALSSSTDTSHIPDVVIPPLSSTTDEVTG